MSKIEASTLCALKDNTASPPFSSSHLHHTTFGIAANKFHQTLSIMQFSVVTLQEIRFWILPLSQPACLILVHLHCISKYNILDLIIFAVLGPWRTKTFIRYVLTWAWTALAILAMSLRLEANVGYCEYMQVGIGSHWLVLGPGGGGWSEGGGWGALPGWGRGGSGPPWVGMQPPILCCISLTRTTQ